MLVGSNSSNEIPTEFYLLPAIMGDEELREEAKHLYTRYSHLFSISLSPEAGRSKANGIGGGSKQMETESNQGPTRPQTEPKQINNRVQVAIMLDSGVIRPS